MLNIDIDLGHIACINEIFKNNHYLCKRIQKKWLFYFIKYIEENGLDVFLTLVAQENKEISEI